MQHNQSSFAAKLARAAKTRSAFALGLLRHQLQSKPPSQAGLVDVSWYRQRLLQWADLWNAGLDGYSGMGTYQPDFNGYFHVALDRKWRQMKLPASTTVAQSRAIYMNVEAYRAAPPEDQARFLKAVRQGVDFLLDAFRDAELGGFFWKVTRTGKVADDHKEGYGNIHALFALAEAYSISHDPAHLQAALEQLDVLQKRFFDPDYPGGLRTELSRDFSQVASAKSNNTNTVIHFFEALLALYDAAPSQQVADLITQEGDFITQHLYHDQAGYTDRGYVAFNYDPTWQPSQIPFTPQNQWFEGLHTSTGHDIELAYFLSRAVERGFDRGWLSVADKLLKFCLEYSMHPQTGGMRYYITDYEGRPLKDSLENHLMIGWAQTESARALLHFSVVRGEDYAAEFRRVEALIRGHLIDRAYGGMCHALDTTQSLKPVNRNKGDIWQVNYHSSMLFAEILRLGAQYPEQIAQRTS